MAARVRVLAGGAGLPALYISGLHFDNIAGASITFPDKRWLRFPVRGTRRTDAIMTAVDDRGDSVVRYRLISPDSRGQRTASAFLERDDEELSLIGSAYR